MKHRGLGLAAAFALLACGSAEPHEHEHDGHEHEHDGHEHGDDQESESHGESDHALHEDEDHEHEEHQGSVKLSAAAIAASQIQVGPVDRRALTGRVGWPAEVRFDPQSTAHVRLPTPGRVVSVAVELGQEVARGDTLAVVSSTAANEVRAQLERVTARLEAADAALERHRGLRDARYGSERAVIDSQAEVTSLRAEARGLSSQLRVLGASSGGNLRLRAPLGGIVAYVAATPGETRGVEDTLFTVADPGAVSVYGEVPEIAVADVRQGLQVIFRPQALPDLAAFGRIQYLAPALTDRTRSLSIRVSLAEVDPRLRSGMYGTIEVIGDERLALAVPTSAVVTLNGAPTVFTPGHEEGEFEPRPVHIGRRAGRFYELLGGLEDGEEIVLTGAFTLKGAMSTEGFAEHDH